MTLILHSQRLTLAPLAHDDLSLCVQMFTDPIVVRYASGVMSKTQIKSKMKDWVKRGGNGCIGIWTVSDRMTAEQYGSAALLPMPIEESDTDYEQLTPERMPNGPIEIGYFLKRTAWGHGYATEACRRLLRFAFENTKLNEVVATFDRDNHASRNVLLKAGFTNRGTMRCYGSDGLNFRITQEEWSKQRGQPRA